MSYQDPDRQMWLMMMLLSELKPGCVCMDSRCPTGEPVPHMANDAGNHPHPYGLISTPSHEWRRKRWRPRPRLPGPP